MGLLSQLVRIALEQLFERGAIEWLPEEKGAPETFQATCELEVNVYAGPWGGTADFFVTMNSVFCIVDAASMECWHSSRIEVEA